MEMRKPSVAALAAALMREHGFEFDVAYLSAWYGSGNEEPPTASPAQALAWMERVKTVPSLTREEAAEMLAAYSRHRGGSPS